MKVLLDYHELKKNLEKMFTEAGIDEFADIDWIMVEVTGKQRSMLPFHGKFSTEETKQIMDAVEKRLKHIPLAYIFGKTSFFGYDFDVDKNVLIPRLDTEVLVEKLVEDINLKAGKPSVLDIGTGSGAIAIVIQKETGAKVTAVDVSQKALDIAKHNAKKNNAEVDFILSDLFKNVDGKFDFVVSNPPYIETDIVKGLDKEVVENEPILALDGGVDGLDYYRKIVNDAPKYLNNEGYIMFELGINEAMPVKDFMEKDFQNIEIIKDLAGIERVILGKLRS